MTTKEAAKYLGISEYYLRNMRHLLHNHNGPKVEFIKNTKGKGNKIIANYLKEDLDVWKSQHKWKKQTKELQ